MRVIISEGVPSPTYNQAFSYGEQEDYLINIIGVAPQDPNKTYSWSPAGGTTPTTTVNPLTTTTYTVAVNETGNVCTNYAMVTVTAIPLPATPVAFDDAQCGFGVPSCFVTGSGGTYNWYLTIALILQLLSTYLNSMVYVKAHVLRLHKL
jgi:hypothetical protein